MPHQKPAQINLDDNDDEEDLMDVNTSSQSRWKHLAASNAQNSSESSSEGSENPDDNLSKGNDDLTCLNSALLRKKISSEVKLLLFLFV